MPNSLNNLLGLLKIIASTIKNKIPPSNIVLKSKNRTIFIRINTISAIKNVIIVITADSANSSVQILQSQ